MIARKRGGILNVSSSAGFLPVPGFAVYAATKAYVTSFLEALRAELHGTGSTVCALAIPGIAMKLGMFLVRITPMPILRLLSRLSPRRG
jgi:short-subunit dehydrogenase